LTIVKLAGALAPQDGAMNAIPTQERAAPLAFDPGLIRKYDGFGPRYTSYPTADRFHEGFGAA